MLKRARGINQYGSLRLSISLDDLVLLTELIKLYIKAYLQKTFENIYYFHQQRRCLVSGSYLSIVPLAMWPL